MAIYRLFEEPLFPDPAEADPDGLLAVGGDLSPQRLVNAYASCIFPWYGENSPILWWSTDPRPVIVPGRHHLPRSLRKVIRSGRFEVAYDREFEAVIRSCAAAPRPGQDGTWIVEDMVRAYLRLHELGLCHSVEARLDGELVGGLYGVSLGRAFFGESMFWRVPDASKVAFAHLLDRLARWDFELVDCQQTTPHVLRFGACELSREDFSVRLERALNGPTRQGSWAFCRKAEPAEAEFGGNG